MSETNPDAVKRLTDDEVANIRFDLVNSKPSPSPMGLFRQHCEDLLAEHDALCATVWALQTQLDDTAQLAAKAGATVAKYSDENTALREQLAQLLQSQESTLDHNRSLIAELAQVTQERDRLQEQLVEEVAKRVNSNVGRMEQSQKVEQAELERHCSDDRLTDTQRGSYQD